MTKRAFPVFNSTATDEPLIFPLNNDIAFTTRRFESGSILYLDFPTDKTNEAGTGENVTLARRAPSIYARNSCVSGNSPWPTRSLGHQNPPRTPLLHIVRPIARRLLGELIKQRLSIA